MADSVDFNSWLKLLECPQSYTPDNVKNTLHKGVLGLIWEDLPRVIRPLSEVYEVRKNILLYKLKNETKDYLLQSIRSNSNLKKERKKLDIKIKIAEETWNQQEFICRQKAHVLEKKKEEKQNLILKKEILKIKHEQMLMQIENCIKMQEICRHLMPPSGEEISQSTIIDCLALVSNYSGGPEKRRVWNKISDSLSCIKIPLLWNALLAARSHYTDYLIHLDIEEDQQSTKNNRANIDIGIAKICSEHLDNVAKRHIHNGRMRNNETMIMEYVEKIEEIIEKQNPELNDWLPLTLEVKKLEVLQTELQNELENLEEQLPVENLMIDDVLIQLITEIKNVDSKTKDCVQEIQNAFGLLKTSGMLITKTRECLVSELEKFQLLQINDENQWINIDLNTELNIFHNTNINALRKIMLKGQTGVYKHLQTCYNKAPIVVDIQKNNGRLSNFPMVRMPIYYLVDLYKTYIVNGSLNKRISEEITDSQENVLESPIDSPTETFYFHQRLFDLLRLTDATCERTTQYSEEFEQILKAWSNQTVREVVSKIFTDKTVYGATLDEWQKRFSMIVYVLQKSNINVA